LGRTCRSPENGSGSPFLPASGHWNWSREKPEIWASVEEIQAGSLCFRVLGWISTLENGEMGQKTAPKYGGCRFYPRGVADKLTQTQTKANWIKYGSDVLNVINRSPWIVKRPALISGPDAFIVARFKARGPSYYRQDGVLAPLFVGHRGEFAICFTAPR
jgi:hypothetical protein